MELTQEYFDQQLKKLTENMATKEDLKDLATTESLTELRDSLVSVLASKADILDIQEILKRLDQRTDEDVRTVIKDVEQIKGVLKQQGYSFSK